MKQFSGSCLLHHAFEDGVVPGEARVRDMKVVAATTGLRSYAEKIHIFYIFFFYNSKHKKRDNYTRIWDK